MFLVRKLAFALLVTLFASHGLSSHALAQEIKPPPLSAYGELPDIEGAALSPSGQRTAMIIKYQGMRLLIAKDAQNNVLMRSSVDGKKVRSMRWIGEDRILLTYSATQRLGAQFVDDKFEFVVGLSIPIDPSEESWTVFDRTNKVVNAIFGFRGVRKIDGRWYGYFGGLELKRGGPGSLSRPTFKHGRPLLYRVDLQTNNVTEVASEAQEGHSRNWRIDANGQVAVVYDIDDITGEWTIRNGSSDLLASGTAASGRSGLIGLGKEGRTIIYYEANGDEPTVSYEVPLAGGERTEFLPGVSVDRLYFDDLTGHFIGHLEDGTEPKPVFDDEAREKTIRKVQAAFRQMEDMQIIDWSDDFGHFIVRTTGVQDSGTWFAVDVANLRAHAIGYERIAIGPQQVGHFSTFAYTASDGLEMDGILTLPPGREPTNLPVVMLPHGGPHAHDREQFDWWAQAFASRGYAVFQPNFRGSTNRDRDFRVAGYGEWGRKMQTDISDGLAALANAGTIDPSRACIVGASYGGYAALAGVILQQDLYRCAVAVAPVTDIDRIYRQDYRANRGESVTKEALLEQFGDPSIWKAVSPQRHAANADAPIMLIHGKDDTVVPYEHSVKMADALKDEGKMHEFVTLDGEDHWLSLSETRQEMLNATMRFVQEHNPAD